MFPGRSRRGGYHQSRRGGGRFVSSSRGRGAPPNRKWVRSRETDDHSSFAAVGIDKATVPDLPEKILPSKTRGVVLKGPVGRHSWKRPRETAQNVVQQARDNSEQQGKGPETIITTQQQPLEDFSTNPVAQSIQSTDNNNASMMKRGRNKLVLSNNRSSVAGDDAPASTNETKKSTSVHEPMMKRGHHTFVLSNTHGTTGDEASTNETKASTDPMIKRGHHKLILSKGSNETTQPPTIDHVKSGTKDAEPAAQQTKDAEPKKDSQPQTKDSKPRSEDQETMTKQGRNKLTLSKADGAKKDSQKSLERHGRNKLVLHGGDKGKKRRGHVESSRGRGRGRGGVKRIKLVHTKGEEDRKSEDEDSKQPAGGDDDDEKYTEFAYRSTVSHRGRGRKAAVNMGLVRVEPNAATTKICPTFLSGVSCTNPKCTKRHDVSKEAATPICSFFQRHGQCLKGEACPFRHVKVNPHATVCPSFSLLGFCENKNCVMKHIRPNKKKPAASL